MPKTCATTALTFMLAMLAISLAGQVPAVGTPAAPLVVPEGNGAPVITDGVFSAGEWDDALRRPLGGGVEFFVKEWRGVVFIGVRGEGGLGPSELSLAAPGGPIQKLHRSFQLYEVVVPPAGKEPEPRFGLTTDWYANEMRRDMAESERLQKEGLDPMTIMRKTSYPSDGIEFAIRRSRIAGQTWLMRLWASALIDGKPGMLTYPPDAPERTTAGWLELRLR